MSSGSQQTKLPPSFAAFVKRALANVRTKQDRTVLRTQFRRIIQEGSDDGSLWTTDWSNEPLPSVPSAVFGRPPSPPPRPHPSAVISHAPQPLALPPPPPQAIPGLHPALLHQNGFALNAGPTPQPLGLPHHQPQPSSLYPPQLTSLVPNPLQTQTTSLAPRKRTFAEMTGTSFIPLSAGPTGDGVAPFHPQSRKRRRIQSGRQPNPPPVAFPPRTNSHTMQKKKKKRTRRRSRPPPASALPSAPSSLFPTPRTRQRQFSSTPTNRSLPPPPPLPPNEEVSSIEGTLTSIESDYVRDKELASQIRPFRILKQSLANIKTKYLGGQVDYNWICNQFKSLRQDLRIQNIENDFTVRVYESHARIALSNHDLAEFNQCLAVLFGGLYSKNFPESSKNLLEFVGYRVLYLSFTRNDKELGLFLSTLVGKDGSSSIQEEEEGNSSPIQSIYFKHAITVHTALLEGNWVKIYSFLTQHAPKMGRFVIECFRDLIMTRILLVMTRSHICTHIPLPFVMKAVGLEDLFHSDKGEAVRRLVKLGAVVRPERGLDAAASYKGVMAVQREKMQN